jgi:hypothetical protein
VHDLAHQQQEHCHFEEASTYLPSFARILLKVEENFGTFIYVSGELRFSLTVLLAMISGALRWLFVLGLCLVSFADKGRDEPVQSFFSSHNTTQGHTNNWAVLVCASRYWFNYRVSYKSYGI